MPRNAALGLVLLLLAGPSSAAIFTVNSTVDAVDANVGDGVCAAIGGACTLRAAVMEANADFVFDLIELPAGHYVLSIEGPEAFLGGAGDLEVSGAPLKIEGDDATTTIIDANGIDAVFEAFSGLTLFDVTVRGGADTGIRSTGSLTLDACIVEDNVGVLAGGIVTSSASSLTILDSIVRRNEATSSEGVAGVRCPENNQCVIDGSAFIRNLGDAIDAKRSGGFSLTNSTVSGNDGTGVNVEGGVARITQSTFVNNATGVRLFDLGQAVTYEFWGNILDNDFEDCFLVLPVGEVDTFYNLVSDETCGFTGAGDVNSILSQLPPLADNGGLTPTHRPNAGGPAVNTYRTVCADFDQRGIARPQGAFCDKGSVEIVPEPLGGAWIALSAVAALARRREAGLRLGSGSQ